MGKRCVIGIDIGGTGCKGALVDEGAQVLDRYQQPTDITAGTKSIISVAEELARRAATMGAELSGIGIGAAGFINAVTGSVVFSPNLSYDDPQIAAAVSARFDLPVTVDNDANAAAWGERVFGTAQGFDHVALLTLGTGIGSGFIVDGRLLRGATGAAAEVGHTIVDIDGPPCPCGLRGCLESLASGRAIAAAARAAVADEPSSAVLELAGSIDAITARHVARAATDHDEVARTVLRRAGRALGIGLSNVVNLFDPQVIVLGGGVVAAGEPYLGAARDELAACLVEQRRRPVRLDVTTLGQDGGIIGAAALAMARV
ncbi:MAG: ROK family protein [Actinomycetota bacterium]